MISWDANSIIIILDFQEFFTPALANGFSLEFEWEQVSRILLSILTDINKVAVWMISIYPFISKSSSPYTNPLVTVPRVPITIGITFTFMFHIFFTSLVRSKYLSFFSLSFKFTLWSTGTVKLGKFSFFFVNYH